MQAGGGWRSSVLSTSIFPPDSSLSTRERTEACLLVTGSHMRWYVDLLERRLRREGVTQADAGPEQAEDDGYEGGECACFVGVHGVGSGGRAFHQGV